MGRKHENTGFVCAHCGELVLPLTNGSYRNHCPFCLYSRHVDSANGDRLCSCHGLMQPVGIKRNRKKGYQIIHRCQRCGTTRSNKAAGNTIQPDNIEEIIKLM